MINKPVIIGCGTVGSTLSFGLAKSKLVSDLKLYDFDTVSEFENSECYPFKSFESGLLKVRIVKFYCKYLNPSLKIVIYPEKITKPLSSTSFVIDCRDCKKQDIGANIRISLDGHMLYIDSMSYKESEFDYHRYISARNQDCIERAIDIVIDYLVHDLYIYKDFRFYDLRSGDMHILKRENFYGVSLPNYKFG